MLDNVEPSTPNDLDFLNSPSFQNFMASMDADSPTTTNSEWHTFDASLPVLSSPTANTSTPLIDQQPDYSLFNLATTHTLPPDFQDLTPSFLLDRTLLHLQDAEQEWLLAQSPLRTITMRTTPCISNDMQAEELTSSPASFAFEQTAACVVDAAPLVDNGVQATPALGASNADHTTATMWHTAGSMVSSTNTPVLGEGTATAVGGQDTDGVVHHIHDNHHHAAVAHQVPQRITFASPVQSKLDTDHALPAAAAAASPSSPMTPTGGYGVGQGDEQCDDVGQYDHVPDGAVLPALQSTVHSAQAARRAAVSHEGTKLYAMMLQHLQQQQQAAAVGGGSPVGTPVRQPQPPPSTQQQQAVGVETSPGAVAASTPPYASTGIRAEDKYEEAAASQSTSPSQSAPLGHGSLDAWLESIGWTGVPPAVHTQLAHMWVAAGQLAHVMQLLQLGGGGKERGGGEGDPMRMLTTLEQHVEAMVGALE